MSRGTSKTEKVPLAHPEVELFYEHYDFGSLAWVILNRPTSANSFDQGVLDGLSEAWSILARKESAVRAAVLCGRGKNFCAGADLTWMRAMGTLPYEENLASARAMARMFDGLAELTMPTIAAVTGAAYGGAVGLVACCDYAVALESSRFCLSEVKLGLVPAVIWPHVRRKIASGDLQRLALTGQVFSAAEARQCGLVQMVCPSESALATALEGELSALMQGGPKAQTVIKAMEKQIRQASPSATFEGAAWIADVRTGDEAQAGLQAFLSKKNVPWQGETLPGFWSQHVRNTP